MKLLLDLVNVVSRRKAVKIEILDGSVLRNKQSKFQQFYEAISTGKVRTDEEAARLLYQTSSKDDKYRQLKSRLTKRLLNSVFLLDINLPTAGDYEQALANCYRKYSLARLLHAYGSPHAAQKVTRQALTLARQYRFTELILSAARFLRQEACAREDTALFEEYNELIAQNQPIWEAEVFAEEQAQRLKLQWTDTRSSPDPVAMTKHLEQISAQLIQLSEQHSSPVILLNTYRVWLLRYKYQEDYNAVVEVSSQVDEQIRENPKQYPVSAREEFWLSQMWAHLHLLNFARGKEMAEHALPHIQEGSENWIQFLEYYILLAMHTDHFLTARAILGRFRNAHKSKVIPVDTYSRWQVLQGYLQVLSHGYAAQAPTPDQPSAGESPVLLAPDLPESSSKQDRPLLVHRFIISFLNQLEKGQYRQASDQIAKAKDWSERKLKDDRFRRSLHFIRLLNLLAKANFRKSELKYHQRHLKALKQTPWQYRDTVFMFEPYLFEKLWQQILPKLR